MRLRASRTSALSGAAPIVQSRIANALRHGGRSSSCTTSANIRRSYQLLVAVHGRGPAVVEIDLTQRAAIATLRTSGHDQAQRALAAVRDQRAAPAGRDLTEVCAVDPHVD